MHPLIGTMAVGLTDPRLIVGSALLILTLVLIRARALLHQPQEPRRAPRRASRRATEGRARDRTEHSSN